MCFTRGNSLRRRIASFMIVVFFGNERSVLEGALNANGNVFLINANGILMTGTSTVNAAGFVASTLDISNEDFDAGRYTFRANGSRNSVINRGTINAN